MEQGYLVPTRLSRQNQIAARVRKLERASWMPLNGAKTQHVIHTVADGAKALHERIAQRLPHATSSLQEALRDFLETYVWTVEMPNQLRYRIKRVAP